MMLLTPGLLRGLVPCGELGFYGDESGSGDPVVGHKMGIPSRVESCMVSHPAKNQPASLEKKTHTEPPLNVIYPKIGKGNAQRNLERHGLATREKRFGSRLREGKVLAPLTS